MKTFRKCVKHVPPGQAQTRTLETLLKLFEFMPTPFHKAKHSLGITRATLWCQARTWLIRIDNLIGAVAMARNNSNANTGSHSNTSHIPSVAAVKIE